MLQPNRLFAACDPLCNHKVTACVCVERIQLTDPTLTEDDLLPCWPHFFAIFGLTFSAEPELRALFHLKVLSHRRSEVVVARQFFGAFA